MRTFRVESQHALPEKNEICNVRLFLMSFHNSCGGTICTVDLGTKVEKLIVDPKIVLKYLNVIQVSIC